MLINISSNSLDQDIENTKMYASYPHKLFINGILNRGHFTK